jgi:hypothetical protein
VTSADTEVEGEKPPRGTFPRKAVTIQPGTSAWIHDDPIDLHNMTCDNLDGNMDIKIKYGILGRERIEMNHKGTVEIFLEPYGLSKGIYFHPASSEEDSVPRSSS